MAQQTLNDGVSFGEQRSKINSNFTELYSTKTNNSNAAIVGGTIDATSIGQTTPAAGAFTTLSATGNLGVGPLGAAPVYQLDVSNGGVSGAKLFRFTGADSKCLYGYSDSGGTGICNSDPFSGGALYYQDGPSHKFYAGGSLAAWIDIWRNLEVFGSGTFKGSVSAAGLSVSGNLTATGRLTTAGIKEDSAGNVGIGTNTPADTLTVVRGSASIGVSSGTGSTEYPAFSSLNFRGYLNNRTAVVRSYDQSINTALSGGLEFLVNPNMASDNQILAVKIDASGNLLVGTTSYALSNDDNVMIGGPDGVVYVQHSNGRVSGSSYINFNYNSGIIGSITQVGTTSVAYNTTSDHRLKENIRPANAGRFNDIKFVDFEWIDGRHDCGVIAHQLQEIYPDLVIGEKDATEIRKVEITPAVPAVTEQQLVSEAIFNEDGEEIEPAVYETIEITPAVEAVFEDQEFPVYQQVNYIGLIGRMGTRIQMLDKLANEQAEVISKLEARLSAIEAKLN